MALIEKLTALGNSCRSLFGTSQKYTIDEMGNLIGGIGKQAAKTVTPSTTDQTAVASGVYTTGVVTVKGDANLKAENIAEGVNIFGIAGVHTGGAKTVRVTVDNYGSYSSILYIDTNGVLRQDEAGKSGQVIEAVGGVLFGSNSINAFSYSATGGKYTFKQINHLNRVFTFSEDGGRLEVYSGGGSNN